MILSMIKRMIRRALPPLILVVLIGVWPLPIILSQSDEIIIDNISEERKKSRNEVHFPHAVHMDAYECLDCHHDYQNGENVLDEDDLDEEGAAACSSCHTPSATIDLKRAYHRQCMNCHRDINRQPDYDLPITCKDCHPKRSTEPQVGVGKEE